MAYEFLVHSRPFDWDIGREMQQNNMNPWGDYEKHPVIAREIKMGLTFLKNRNTDIPEYAFYHRYNFSNNALEFYVGEPCHCDCCGY